MQSKILPDLQTLRSTCDLGSKTPRRALAEGSAVDFPMPPARRSKADESVRVRFLEFPQPPIEDFLSPSTVEIDICAYMRLVQPGDQCINRPAIPSAAKVCPKVIVRVDDRKPRSLDAALPAHELR